MDELKRLPEIDSNRNWINERLAVKLAFRVLFWEFSLIDYPMITPLGKKSRYFQGKLAPNHSPCNTFGSEKGDPEDTFGGQTGEKKRWSGKKKILRKWIFLTSNDIALLDVHSHCSNRSSWVSWPLNLLQSWDLLANTSDRFWAICCPTWNGILIKSLEKTEEK